ncbi:MAG: peptide deformylase [Bacilli bacterium]|nr:peptide deformylase [Acholeplasmataceae bacterium]MDY2902014.1 peptide deformylase [Bacilli bacterium]
MLNYNSIIKEDNLDLRKQSENVKIPLSTEDTNLILDLHEYLINGYDEKLAKKYNIRPGVGIAAPQVDVLKKMFVIVAYDEHDELHEYGVINPKIVSQSEELTYLKYGEGCLSVDREVKGLVHRPKRITVEFDSFDFDNEITIHTKMRLKGYIAVVFQHEYDHLFGKLFIDHINKENPFFVPSNSSPVHFDFEDEEK